MQREIGIKGISGVIFPNGKRLLSLCICVGFLLPSLSWGNETFTVIPSTGNSEVLELVVGKSKVINSPEPITRASIANPGIADTVVLSPTQLYLIGKSTGETNITLWDVDGEVLKIYDLRVTPGLASLKTQLFELLGEKNISIAASQGYVSLSGTVSSPSNLSQALLLAEAFAPKKVLNRLQVGGVQQVMLEVRIAEMSRSLGRRLGVNLNVINDNDFAVTRINSLNTPTIDDGTITNTFSDAVNFLFRISTGTVTLTGFIDALKENGLVKVLAEPNLITLSGQEATFLAGGEFPVPVPQGLGTVAVQFKPFGVGVTFLPVVLGPDKISLKVTPEVSELDFSRAVTIQGFNIPALTTRRASTVVELSDGQSLAIAGLIQDTVRENISKFPILGDLPILGALFRSSEFQKNETELVIIVTPHLVKPLDMTKQTLPTDGFIEPDDYSFYMLGLLENPSLGNPTVKNHSALSSSLVFPPKGPESFDGKFGHLIPLGGTP